MTASPSITDELIRNADSLRALARDLLGDPALADDVVQQACVTAMVRPPGSRRDIPAWLRAVVRTCALDFRRAERRRRLREQSAAKPEVVEAGDGSPVDTAQRIDLQQDILAAVRSLAEPYRTTVWLRYYEQLTPTEIAARVGQAVPTVKMRLWRALQLLRQRLDGRYGRSGWMAALAPLVQGPATTAGTGAALATGALFMQTKQIAIAAAVVLLVLTGATLAWPSGEVPPSVPGEPSRAAAAESSPLGEAAAAAPERRAVADGVTEAAAVVAPYGDLVVQVRWHDGTPAPGVAIVCHAEGEPQLDQNEVRVVAGEDGVARVAHLHAGDVQLTSDRGGKATARIEAGGASAAEFVLPRGIDVVGTVTDDGQRPVAGARIFVASGGTGWLGGRTVAATGADGGFTLRSIDVRCSVGALGRGYAPSELIDLEAIERPVGTLTVQVQLCLSRPGATVAGRVADERGEPVEGACVAIGRSRPPEWLGDNRGRREFWTPDVATTGADGVFHCDGVAPGPQPIEVRASGHGTWRQEIECVAGELRTLAVTLSRAVTVRGVVRDTAGGLVAGAVVAVLASPADWQFQGGQRRWNQAFPWPETRSDAAGRFELQGVAPSAVHMFACKRAEPGRPHEGMCRETLTAVAGETIAWNPVLVLGKSIRVRVLYADGEPGRPAVTSGSMRLEAIAERAGPDTELLFGMLLDGTGERFVVSDCLDGPYTVSAQVVRLGQTVHAWQSGVLPDGPEIVLRVPPPPPQGDAIVRGRVVDIGRRVPAGKQAMVVLAANGSERRGACTGDRFEFQTVEAGSYMLLLQVDEDRVFAGAPFTVQAGQVLDVGDLVTEPAASITVTLQAPAGLDLGNVRASLGHGPASRWLAWDGRSLHADSVDAGKHRLTFWSTGWLARPRDVDLVAGQDNQIAVNVVAAPPRAMEILFPFPDRWRIGNLSVRDEAGDVVAERVGTLSAAIGVRALSWKPCLPAGRYTVEAATDTGLTRSWPLDATAAPPGGAQVVRFSMR